LEHGRVLAMNTTATKKISPLPRGIQLTSWKNQDGTRVKKYRVRISRKDLREDRLFDSFFQAKDFLATTKTKAHKQEKALEEIDLNLIKSLFENDKTIKYQLKKFIVEKYEAKSKDNEKKLRQYKAYLSRVKTICETEIRLDQSFVPLEKRKFLLGDLDISEARPFHFDRYIKERTRLKKSGATVKSELALLSSFFTKMIRSKFTHLKDVSHPIIGRVDLDILNPSTRVRKLLTDEQLNTLFELLKNKPVFYAITSIALLTGMRKSEVIFLEAENIDNNYINLRADQAKNGQPRSILMTLKTREIIENLEKKEGRFFDISIDGFNTERKRIWKAAGIAEIADFHSLRRQYISKILDSDFNENDKARLAQITDNQYFFNKYIKPVQRLEKVETLKETMSQVGHNSPRITKKYVVKK
jgi:integrase